MTPTRREQYEAALSSDSPTLALRAVVAALINDAGADRAEIQGELEAWRIELRAEGREDDEDTVLEVLDFLTGWSSPHMQI